MRIILRDYKYLDALKMTNINTLYDRGELLFLKLFNEISHTIDHKLAVCLHQVLNVKNEGIIEHLIFQFAKASLQEVFYY